MRFKPARDFPVTRGRVIAFSDEEGLGISREAMMMQGNRGVTVMTAVGSLVAAGCVTGFAITAVTASASGVGPALSPLAARVAVRGSVMYFLNGKYLTEES
jgi:hypothetical protein